MDGFDSSVVGGTSDASGTELSGIHLMVKHKGFAKGLYDVTKCYAQRRP